MTCRKTCPSPAQAVLLILLLLLIASTQKPKRAPAQEETHVVPVPSCFPVAPGALPIPTFSGNVYTVNTNADFLTQVSSAEADITIQLDGSVNFSYQLPSTQSINKSLRLTSLNPLQPARIIERSGAGTSASQTCLFVTGATNLAPVVIDNIIFVMSLNNAQSSIARCITIQSSTSVFIDSCTFLSQQRSVTIISADLHITRCTFNLNNLVTNATTNSRNCIRAQDIQNYAIVLNNKCVSSLLNLTQNLPSYTFLLMLQTTSAITTQNAYFNISNNSTEGPLALSIFVQWEFQQTALPSNRLYKMYVYNNNIITRLFQTIINPVIMNNYVDFYSFRDNIISIKDVNSNFPLLVFESTSSINVTAFDTIFYLLNNQFNIVPSFTNNRAAIYEKALDSFGVEVAGFVKQQFASVQGTFQGRTSIDCSLAGP